MSARATLLLEIGCEEIPARMITAASRELERRVLEILDEAGLAHGPAESWSGPRRLAVAVQGVSGRQQDRDELVLGPPAKVAFDADGKPTPAALGFAKKQGIVADQLQRTKTERGDYAAFRRQTTGKAVGEVLAARLPAQVTSMPFPKTMRWADGAHRWVRPVHWVVALHGKKILQLELFGVRSGRSSMGHRFQTDKPVKIGSPASYVDDLKRACVLVDPAARRNSLSELLSAAAQEAGGQVVEDDRLLDEVADLVEWPGVVVGRFDERFLELPGELLATTLRHHQKCFSLVDAGGNPMAAFLAVANTNDDPQGHVRRGNEWVVGGRLDDARFFWREDRRAPLEQRTEDLAGVVFHAKVGNFHEKAERIAALAGRLGKVVGSDDATIEHAVTAAWLCKNDLLTRTVGEFPELQGQVGGLMLRAEQCPEAVAQGVYEHYRPAGANDALPASETGALVSVADKLDSIASLIGAGETPTGSRDPLGLRRAGSGVFRIVGDRDWDLSVRALSELCKGDEALGDFLAERLVRFWADGGWAATEIRAVTRDQIDATGWRAWRLADIEARLAAIARVRERVDFEQLADLTKRVDNILTKGREAFESAAAEARAVDFTEDQPSALALAEMLAGNGDVLDRYIEDRRYNDVVDLLAGFVEPVEVFFDNVLVVDPANPAATLGRRDLLAALREWLTRCFDIRELAGQA